MRRLTAASLALALAASAGASGINRDPRALAPPARDALACILRERPDVRLWEGYRSPERQRKLYAQGRTAPGPVVTWTLRSIHSKRLAFDLVFKGPEPWGASHPWGALRAVARRCGAEARAWEAGDLGHYVVEPGPGAP